MEHTPIHRLGQYADKEGPNTIQDCLDEAQESLALAQQMESRGERGRMLQWIQSAQNWLTEAERRAK